jgi:hypothetical protein
MEMAVGQYTQQGPIGAIAKLCPFFKGKKKFIKKLSISQILHTPKFFEV